MQFTVISSKENLITKVSRIKRKTWKASTTRLAKRFSQSRSKRSFSLLINFLQLTRSRHANVDFLKLYFKISFIQKNWSKYVSAKSLLFKFSFLAWIVFWARSFCFCLLLWWARINWIWTRWLTRWLTAWIVAARLHVECWTFRLELEGLQLVDVFKWWNKFFVM